MRTLAVPALVALSGLALIGLVGGDPRAVRDLGSASAIDLAGFVLAIAVGAVAWRTGRRRAWWLVIPSVFLAVTGGLCGWIAGAELTLAPDTAVHLSTTPARVAFMLATTGAGMALLPAALAWLAGIGVKPRDRART